MNSCPCCDWPLNTLFPPLIWVPGKPVTWGLGKSPAGVRVAPPDLKAWQKALWAGWHSQPRRPVEGPVSLFMRFHARSSRADLTNFLKGAEDGLKHIAFGDDSRVYRAVVEKEPAETPDEEGVAFQVFPYRGNVFPSHLGGGQKAPRSPALRSDVRRARGRPAGKAAPAAGGA
jgi:hypothetical protein